jgi:hypothetical protein
LGLAIFALLPSCAPDVRASALLRRSQVGVEIWGKRHVRVAGVDMKSRRCPKVDVDLCAACGMRRCHLARAVPFSLDHLVGAREQSDRES